MRVSNHILNQIKKVALKNPNEICGLITNKSIIFCDNQSKVPLTSFYIDPIIYYNAKYKQGLDILYCFHSHTVINEKPSNWDKERSNESTIPYLIYSTVSDKFSIYYPESIKTIYFSV